MYVIGLTGNFGTGKTTVSNILGGLGARIINADEIGHLILDNDQQAHNELLQAFGAEILDENGKVDRRKLGEKAFKSNDGASTLNRIMRPRVRQKIEEIIRDYNKHSVNVVVLEAALMVKSRWVSLINELWVTTAPEEVIIDRLKNQRNYSEDEILSRLQRQMSAKEMLEQADVVINTNCALDELRSKVRKLWNELMLRMENRKY